MRNLRASGSGRLLLGRKSEPFTAAEVGDDEKVPLLRAYLKRWRMEVGVFFGGVGPDSPRRGAPAHRAGPPRLPDRAPPLTLPRGEAAGSAAWTT